MSEIRSIDYDENVLLKNIVNVFMSKQCAWYDAIQRMTYDNEICPNLT
jgi:hypothetical protein